MQCGAKLLVNPDQFGGFLFPLTGKTSGLKNPQGSKPVVEEHNKFNERNSFVDQARCSLVSKYTTGPKAKIQLEKITEDMDDNL